MNEDGSGTTSSGMLLSTSDTDGVEVYSTDGMEEFSGGSADIGCLIARALLLPIFAQMG